MWLADFQKGLMLFEYFKDMVRYRVKCCSNFCKYNTVLQSECTLFNTILKVRANDLNYVRCQTCRKIFGE